MFAKLVIKHYKFLLVFIGINKKNKLKLYLGSEYY